MGLPFLFKICVVFLLFKSTYSQAAEIAIFDSRKTVSLTKEEPSYRDYFINAGLEVGIQRGALITVVRSASLYDAYQNKTPGDLVVPVGQIKIIHAQKGLSVGRVYKLYSRENLPLIDFDYIMIGDRIDLTTITREKNKDKEASVEKKPEIEKATVLIKPEVTPEIKESAEMASSLPPKEPVTVPNLQ